MNNPTLEQIVKLLELFKEKSSKELEDLLNSGLLADLAKVKNPTPINRDKFQHFLGLTFETEYFAYNGYIVGETTIIKTEEGELETTIKSILGNNNNEAIVITEHGTFKEHELKSPSAYTPSEKNAKIPLKVKEAWNTMSYQERKTTIIQFMAYIRCYSWQWESSNYDRILTIVGQIPKNRRNNFFRIILDLKNE